MDKQILFGVGALVAGGILALITKKTEPGEGELPPADKFLCPFCDQVFSSYEAVLAHMINEHGETPPEQDPPGEQGHPITVSQITGPSSVTVGVPFQLIVLMVNFGAPQSWTINLVGNYPISKTFQLNGYGEFTECVFDITLPTKGTYNFTVTEEVSKTVYAKDPYVPLPPTGDVWDGVSYQIYSPGYMESYTVDGIHFIISYDSSSLLLSREGHPMISNGSWNYPAGTPEYNEWVQYADHYRAVHLNLFGGPGEYISRTGTKVIVS